MAEVSAPLPGMPPERSDGGVVARDREPLICDPDEALPQVARDAYRHLWQANRETNNPRKPFAAYVSRAEFIAELHRRGYAISTERASRLLDALDKDKQLRKGVDQ